MHYLGVVIDQVTREDPTVDIARRQARQRRDVRRARRHVPTERHHWWAPLIQDSGREDVVRKPILVLHWHGLRLHHR
jgi:hypothetical protein